MPTHVTDGLKRGAPYIAFRTFLNSLDALTHGVPPRIDRTIWRTQSGVNQGLIMHSYRFFGLVDDDDMATEELRELVTHPEERQAVLRGLIEIQYQDVLHEHDLTKMTPRMLEDAFDVFAVTGATKRKAITFFLQAAKFADMAMSPFLIAQTRNISGPRRRRSPNGRIKEFGLNLGDQNVPFEDGAAMQRGSPMPPRGSTKTVQLQSGGTLTLSVSLDMFAMENEDRDFVFGLIDSMREYEQKHSDVPQKSATGSQK